MSQHPHHSLMADLAPEAVQYLLRLRRRYSPADMRGFLAAASGRRALVVGEAIIDEFVYVEPMGKSAKEAVLAARHLSDEAQAGGSLAVANHIGDLSSRVDLVTALGDRDARDQFVRERLHPHVQPRFVYKQDSPTIVKRRFVDAYSSTRLLEVYEINDQSLTAEDDDRLCGALEELLPTADAVIVADFGHGLVTKRATRMLEEGARFLALNAQTNAANLGFHTISKYRRADFISIQEREIRLDRRDREGALDGLIASLSADLGTRATLVTRGKYGSLLHSADGVDVAPSLARQVVDRLGAGDAVFSIASLCVAAGVPLDAVSFIANAVGAQAVTVVGNRTAIDRGTLEDYMELLLTEVSE
ncbi:MAG: PfkB family carbohydrate kinase [Dehalococcoidia bacterium]